MGSSEQQRDMQLNMRIRRCAWSVRRVLALLGTFALLAVTLDLLAPPASGVPAPLRGASVSAASLSTASVGGAITDGAPEAVVIVGSSGVIASWWSGSGPRWTCGYYLIEAPFVNSSPDSRSPFGVDPVPGMLYELNCEDRPGHLVVSRFVVYEPADPFGGVAVVERAVAEARRRIDLMPPVPRSNPGQTQLVGLATWLWVENPWFEQTATAALGDITATVHAVPVGVDWDTGDGGHQLCDRGVPYDLHRPPKAQTSGCTHVFQRSSAPEPDGVRHLVATQRWVAWWSSSTGEGGSLGILSRSAELSLRVVELQALVD